MNKKKFTALALCSLGLLYTSSSALALERTSSPRQFHLGYITLADSVTIDEYGVLTSSYRGCALPREIDVNINESNVYTILIKKPFSKCRFSRSGDPIPFSIDLKEEFREHQSIELDEVSFKIGNNITL